MQRMCYAAVMLKVNMHQAYTKYHPDQYVHCDATREEVFAAIEKQPELVVFDSPVYAENYARDKYYAMKALEQNGLFDDGKVQHSNNAELVRIYGEHTVMKQVTVPAIYAYETDTYESNLGPKALKKDGSNSGGYIVSPENKAHLKLTHVAVSPMMYFTDEEIKKDKHKKPVMNSLNHNATTARYDIPVIGSLLRKFF